MIKIGKQGKEISVGAIKKWAITLIVLGFMALMLLAILTGSPLVSLFSGTGMGISLGMIVALSEDMEKKNEPSKKQEGDVIHD